MKLLVFNYSMNGASQVFSHQRRIVGELSRHFSHIDVITAETFSDSDIDKVSVSSTGWKSGRNFTNIFSFYRISIPLLIKHRGGVVFSHMTEVQTFLTVIICKVLRIKHLLWYAHKSASPYLAFSYPFLDAVITSTSGSCPIRGKKVIPIGQAVDTEMFQSSNREPDFPPKSWYHVGRIDPSKNIEAIIEALKSFRKENPTISLNFYGTASSEATSQYMESIRTRFGSTDYVEWVHFHGPIKHSQLVDISMRHDGFIHAFWGSLDKALVEAIMLKRIVVSSNPEYLREFLSQEGNKGNTVAELTKQLHRLYHTSKQDTFSEIQRKYDFACTNHGLQNWINRLVSLLKEN
jgi:glycosyltransferase involved in cell wall biosynthesis